MRTYSFFIRTHRLEDHTIIHVAAYTVSAANIKEARQIAKDYTPPASYDGMYHTHTEVLRD